ncbi:MAG: flavin reductase [Pseudomonadota bacterium]
MLPSLARPIAEPGTAIAGDSADPLQQYRYSWPREPLDGDARWQFDAPSGTYSRELVETSEELANDSRWPAFFPSPMCIVTASDGQRVVIEREVGAAIVNRFPYVVAISICRTSLSERHHPRNVFMDVLQQGQVAALQFLPPGAALDAALAAIEQLPDGRATERVSRSGLRLHEAPGGGAPWLDDAYLVYETALVRPQCDFDGRPIFGTPWIDVGSHRVFFLEIHSIRLRRDIAHGESLVHWRALPRWGPLSKDALPQPRVATLASKYQKGYHPEYVFPAPNTIAFEYDEIVDGMAVKHLPPLAHDQVEIDNDKARWPCFFPSSCGLITSYGKDGTANIMPCGSTTIISRHPMIVAPCISYASINERYSARRSLELLRQRGRFGCSVPFINDKLVDALKYCGNNSLSDDSHKVANSGFEIVSSGYGPRITAAPVHFDCSVIGEISLGTHVMFLGKVERIHVRADVTPANPLVWCPWANVASTGT